MPNNLQDFRGEECSKLLAQGDVVGRQRYVEVSIFEESIAPEELRWPEDDGGFILPPQTVFVGVVGLPAWYLGFEEAVAITAPRPVATRRGRRIVVGTDLTFLPGLTADPPRQATIIDVDPGRIKAGRLDLVAGGERLTLDERTALKLRRRGTVRLQAGSGREVLVRLQRPPSTDTVDRRTGSAPPTPSPGVAYSIAVFSPPVVARHLFDRQGGDGARAILALLADPRSGADHDSSLARDAFVTQMDDVMFAAVLDIYRDTRDWDRCTQHQPTPEHPVFQIAALTVFEQQHVLRGLSRGRLVDSVTLGPEEEVTTEVFTWDRRIAETEQVFGQESEQTLSRTLNTSTTAEITSETNQTVQTGVGGDLGLSLPLKSVGNIDAGVSGDHQQQLDTNTGLRLEQLSQAAVTAAERFKATHQVKLVNRRETGTETRTTRVFRNPNVGRVLHLHHFEVQAHYDVVTRVVDTRRFGLLVDNPPLGPFDRDWVRAHHHWLDAVLLSDAYREGLAAAQLLAAQEWIDEHAAAEKQAREEEQQRRAVHAAGAEPATNHFPNKGIFATARTLKDKLDVYLALGDIVSAFGVLARHLNPADGVSAAALGQAEQTIARTAWWTQMKLAYPSFAEQAGRFSRVVGDADSPQGRQDPETPDRVIAALGDLVSGMDDDWLVALKLFGAAVLMQYLAGPLRLNPLVDLYTLKLLAAPDDLGIPKMLSRARAEHAQHLARQNAETLAPPAPPPETLTPAGLVPAPPRAYSVKELGEAHAALGRLLSHLRAYEPHYTNAFYRHEDPALRLSRLTRLGVARFVDNRILGFAGTKAIYPLRLGALAPSVRDALLAEYRPTAIDPDSPPEITETITVPTGGLSTEAVLGPCDVIEGYLHDRRDAELRLRRAEAALAEAQAEQARQEAERLRLRVEAGNLDPPDIPPGPAPGADD